MSAPTTFALDLKTPVYEALGAIGRALSSARRVELLEHLAQGERSVEALARASGMSVANTSAHLKVLKQAGLVTATRDGKQQLYGIKSADVTRLWVGLRELAERLHTDVALVDGKEAAMVGEPMSLPDVRRAVHDKEATLIDVRSEAEFAAGHLPGAHHVPADDLAAYLGGIRRGLPVLVYGRGRGCADAVRAVRLLKRHGYECALARGGVGEWVARGFALAGPDAERQAPAGW